MMHRLAVVILLLISTTTFAQVFFPPLPYKKGFFASPVKIPVSLAGNFGECRPNHFHSGLDIRTNKVENIPLYAIADGFISKIKIEANGFGNAIYITHANGTISLYAHCNKFFPELENFIRAKQYEQKSWKIELTPLPNTFLIRKGQFIAYSGNTGSSQAPHLHMEIRDVKTDKPLNGLLFYNFPDTKAPLIKKLAIYDAYRSIYDQKPVQYNTAVKGGVYIPTKDTLIVNTKMAGFGIVADDPMDGALGVLGVYEINMFVDNQPYFGWQMNNIGYEETRYMNAIADFKTKKNGGPWIQLCYQLDGDKLPVYKSFNKLKGRVLLDDGKAHQIKIIVKDVNNNQSKMQFWVRSNLSSNFIGKYAMAANKENKYDDGKIAFTLAPDLLYDDVAADISTTSVPNNPYGDLYKVFSADIPVHDYFNLKLKPKTALPKNLWSKVAFVKQPFSKETTKKGIGAKYDGHWAAASVREFGTYELVVDQTAPTVSCGLSNGGVLKGNKISVTAKDETTSVAQFIGKIDGHWVRFVQKGNAYTYEVDQYCPKGNHQLEISAIDENGNTKLLTFAFNN